jgi:hypothetical protein
LLEYLVPLKSVIDIFNGMLQLRNTISDRAIFTNYVTPAFDSMSKIVDDYLSMFAKLETSENGLDRKAVSEFYRDRLKLRALRIQIREMSIAAGDRPELSQFHHFFALTGAVFGDKSGNTPSNFFRHLLEQSTPFDRWEYEHMHVLRHVMQEIESHWELLSREYAKLKLDFAP